MGVSLARPSCPDLSLICYEDDSMADDYRPGNIG
jgi:hypothetical protein